jgi:phosphopantothenoylcysteine decarboxylase
MALKVLICVTGSVAAIKVGELVESLRKQMDEVEVRVVATSHAKFFLEKSATKVDCPLYDDNNEWTCWELKGDPVLHIDLRKWCDVLVICPLSANSLAKIANGMCDNLVTSIVRAWDKSKRMIVCPAMNTFMWENPITERQLEVIAELYNCEIIAPKDNYPLACGDVGPGALASIEDIVNEILRT